MVQLVPRTSFIIFLLIRAFVDDRLTQQDLNSLLQFNILELTVSEAFIVIFDIMLTTSVSLITYL